jgi:hypothetical protein
MTPGTNINKAAIGRIRGAPASLTSENMRIGAEPPVATELAAATAIIKLPNGNGCDGRARAIDG